MNKKHVEQRWQLNGFRWIDPEPEITEGSQLDLYQLWRSSSAIGSVSALDIKLSKLWKPLDDINWREAMDGSWNLCQLSKVSESWMGWWTLLESLDPDCT